MAERNLQGALERAREEAQRAEAQRLNELRRRRLAASKAVDSAWAALGHAYHEYTSLEAELPGGLRALLARRSGYGHRAAAFSSAPDLSATLGINPVQPRHRHPLAAFEAGTTSEQEVEDEAPA